MMLALDGRSLALRTTVPMSADQVRWFCDPDCFLQNVPHLWTLSLRVFCVRCWKRGLQDDVHVTYHEARQQYDVTCECANVKGVIPRSVIRAVLSTDELLQKLGWSLCCTSRCAKDAGYTDGVEANNNWMAETLMITCGCTSRVYVKPSGAAAVVS